VTSDATGAFVSALAPGTCGIRTFAAEFGPYPIANVEIKAGQDVRQNFQMDISLTNSSVRNAPLAFVVPVFPPAGKFTGEIINLDIKEMELKNFFRFIADVSGLNIILDPDVDGTVTASLSDVPWDQALDLVLKNNGLESTQQGNVLRISKAR